MKILIATPLYPPDVGGPAQYAKEIHEELNSRSIEAPVVSYGKIEKGLPSGLRHIAYGTRLLRSLLSADAVLALDTWSVGLPALLLSRLFRKKFLVRIGGDFLWEGYVERTGNLVKLTDFYASLPRLSLKERLIRRGTAYLLAHADYILFTTTWQRDIWKKQYVFREEKVYILENYYPPREEGEKPDKRSFLFMGRAIKLKNDERFGRVFERIKKRYPDIELDGKGIHFSREGYLERVRRSYAVVLPSVSDVNPNMIIDAVRFGKPFLCTQDTGIYERLKGVGVFVDTLDEQELERGIEELLDPKRYGELSTRLRSFSYTHSWEEIVNELLACVRKP